MGLTPKAVQRFQCEAEAAAKLYHTNIVPVYATGEEDGTHFELVANVETKPFERVSVEGLKEPLKSVMEYVQVLVKDNRSK